MSGPYRASAESHLYVLNQVRRTDRDRFLGALFAAEPQRRDLLAVLAFDHELARARTVAHEPMLAAIRLQWWREAVEEAAGARRPRAQPLVEALAEAMRRRRLSAEPFATLIAAREQEIDSGSDPPRAGRAIADLALAVLGIDHGPTRGAARAIATARLTGEGPARDALIAEARAQREAVDPLALPVLLPALSLGGTAPWLRPLAYWWAARRGRY